MHLTTDLEELFTRRGWSRDDLEKRSDLPIPSYYPSYSNLLKLFPHGCEDRRETEIAALTALGGRPLFVADCPEIEEAGPHHLVLRCPRGQELGECWSEMIGEEREDIAHQLGLTLADLHDSRHGELPATPWADFVAQQRAGLVQRQRSLGAPPQWLKLLTPFLDEMDQLASDELVLLHTRLTFSTALARHGPGGWTVTGVQDFEHAMLGPREFDIAWTLLSVAKGKRPLVRRMLDGLGVQRRDLELQRRLLGMVLVHPAFDLTKCLRRLGVPRLSTMNALARRWFPL
ncbi:phosphotransferase family protein [Allokutzneria sp. NRRL B-24872]|uniref:phosphotransferase family protein n=1 Tax=Allokutzneria sp. NRRL B-24872 TaxID=1137961 RepID=UPI000A382F7C|nr:phosphotransferase [Allokutzneria sp. NRRL B-24872]